MIGIGKPAPQFRLPGTLNGKIKEFSLSDFRNRWLVLFFYPADFTFICPTEVLGFQKKLSDFERSNAATVGISVDPVETHIRWAQELKGLSYPLLSDVDGKVSRLYGVLDEEEGVSQRATFIHDPETIILYTAVTAMNVGRSVAETYRVLKALQSGRLCPAEWNPGQETGEPSLKY